MCFSALAGPAEPICFLLNEQQQKTLFALDDYQWDVSIYVYTGINKNITDYLCWLVEEGMVGRWQVVETMAGSENWLP